VKLSSENKATLLIHLHKSIEESANTNTNHIAQGRISQLTNYPPNGGLNEKEIRALEQLKGNEELKSALRKVLASTTADIFNIMERPILTQGQVSGQGSCSWINQKAWTRESNFYTMTFTERTGLEGKKKKYKLVA
jgi:hypothetical protein